MIQKNDSIILKIKKAIPFEVKRTLFRLKHYGRQHYCNVCNSNLKRFLPGGLDIPVIYELDIVGAGYHKYDYCPVCKASYRQRLVKLYLDTKDILSKKIRILHVAPEVGLFHLLRKNNKKDYICGDLNPDSYNYYAHPEMLDLTQLSYPDNSFDLIVCNHVLEHIPDDNKAIKEIYRVLDYKGIAILQVPISLKLKETYEDNSIIDAQDRLAKFGQKDHVRIYAQDYQIRLEKAGFEIELFSASSESNTKYIDKMMLDPREKLYIGKKL